MCTALFESLKISSYIERKVESVGTQKIINYYLLEIVTFLIFLFILNSMDHSDVISMTRNQCGGELWTVKI